jgi:hypothetical protein
MSQVYVLSAAEGEPPASRHLAGQPDRLKMREGHRLRSAGDYLLWAHESCASNGGGQCTYICAPAEPRPFRFVLGS